MTHVICVDELQYYVFPRLDCALCRGTGVTRIHTSLDPKEDFSFDGLCHCVNIMEIDKTKQKRVD